MQIIVDAIVKKADYQAADPVTHKKAATKIRMFDLELGDDIELKFPGEHVLKPGTPISIQGQFTISKYQNFTTLTAVQGAYSMKVSGRLVLDDQSKSVSK